MPGSIYGRLHLEQYHAWHGVLAFYRLIKHTTQGSPTGSWRDCGPARREVTEARLSRVAYMHFQGMGVNCDRAKVGHKILLMADEDASRPCRTSLSYRVMNGELLTQDFQRLFFLRPYSHDQIQNDSALRRFSKGAFDPRTAVGYSDTRPSVPELEPSLIFRLLLQLSRPGQFSLVMSVILV